MGQRVSTGAQKGLFDSIRAEAMFRSGTYLETPNPPAKLGYEAAGEIQAIGEGVTGFSVGDAVSTIPAFSMTKYGVYGDTAIVPAHAVVKHPTNLSWSESRCDLDAIHYRLWRTDRIGPPFKRRGSHYHRGFQQRRSCCNPDCEQSLGDFDRNEPAPARRGLR